VERNNKETNETETVKTTQSINEKKRWFFEKINKINKPLNKATKDRRRRSKLIKLEMKREKLSRDG
jgi:ribosomal protein S15P/S13E